LFIAKEQYLYINTIALSFQGAELAAQEGQSAAALVACRTLAEELSEQRFPAPRILSFKVSLLFFLMISGKFGCELTFIVP
jgi:hypothetical protein